MWITLSLAALTTAGLGARGRPWHGVVAGTLGFYLADAGWSLMASGTGGFMETVTSGTWWPPATFLGISALVTGAPAIRRRLFGRSAWRRSLAAGATEIQREGPSTPDWQRAFLDMALVDPSAAWGAGADSIIDESQLARRTRTRGQLTSMEHRVSGVLGQAIQALDQALSAIPAATSTTTHGLTAEAWTQLLALGTEGEVADKMGLAITDQAELVLRAASHSMDAGLALGWRWFSGVEAVFDHLGTDEQKSEFLPHLSMAGSATAAGWSGREFAPSKAVVTRDTLDGKEVLGLRVTCDITMVVGADSAAAVSLLVPTSDPDGLLSARAEPLEWSCVLIGGPCGLSVLDGVHVAERLGGHACTGRVRLNDVFIAEDRIVGGEAGIGAVGHRLTRQIEGAEAVRTAALLAGRAQREAALRGSIAILQNVMSAETIEAWSHAGMGASVLSSTAVSRASALILEERPLTLAESRDFRAAAQRLAFDLLDAPAEAESINEEAESDAGALELVSDGTPAHVHAGREATHAGWEATWQQDSLAARLDASPDGFDLARARGLREATSTALRAGAQSILTGVPGARSRGQDGLGEAFSRLARAHALLRTLTARRASKYGTVDALKMHLRHAEERWTVCVSLALLDRLGGSQPNERPLFEFAVLNELACIFTELNAAAGQVQGALPRLACRAALRAASAASQGPPPHLAETVAASLAATPEMLHRLTADSCRGHAENGGTAPALEASRLAASSRVPIASIQRAQAVGQLPDDEFSAVLELAVARRIASATDVARIRSCMAVASEFLSMPGEVSADQNERRSA